MDTSVLAGFAAILFAALSLFQLAPAAGAPFGHVVYGGRKALPDNRLPTPLRIASLGASALLLVLGWIMLARASVVTTDLSDTTLAVAAWMVVAFMALNTAGNMMADHPIEKWVFVGVSGLLVIVCSVVAAVGPP